ncbi:hypothetical protein [Grimontia sp. NTOU-MAR1]|uniref:hypothetical protein n=1 Tax=Grimontia sp. NTOU-MAR1 TaxID=3111011 RepID=UPI002DBD02F2|nr:hypothetical protein [Grimontia sp. NTOU-MAR1]WRV98333.1 hypothetical protein VP504_02540 [Grimontia sp. NTOU-MAR1]
MTVRYFSMLLLGVLCGFIADFSPIHHATPELAEYRQFYEEFSKKGYLTDDEMVMLEDMERGAIEHSLNPKPDFRGLLAASILLLFLIIPFTFKKRPRPSGTAISAIVFFVPIAFFTSWIELSIYIAFGVLGVCIAWFGLRKENEI